MAEYNCSYCKHWGEAKKLKNNSRICKITKRKIDLNKKIKCIYFNPESFFCEQNECRISVIVCLNRRRNLPEFENWIKCKQCRQFEKEIKDFAIEYWIEGKNILTKKTEKKIKRRGEKRQIKRRKKQRQIKRRNK